MRRRTFIRSSLAACATSSVLSSSAFAGTASSALHYGEAFPFSFDSLVVRARNLSREPYKEPYRPAPDIVSRIDYEVHGRIHWKREKALFVEGPPTTYPVTFFHLGQYFQKSIKMHEVRGDKAREILYDPEDFDMPADSIARQLPKDAGFAGFRLHESKRRSDWKTQDWVAFLGASYFRTIGALNQYGLSARGIAINTTASVPEEFPDFTEFYLQQANTSRDPVIVYALLNGPSITGAYRIACRRTTGVVTEVENVLFLRKDIEQLGIAPLTSMYWFGENDRGYRTDWRPEVHDSDGLAIWNGNGERIFRPLNNPTRVVTSSFLDKNPKGFGLLQRDRSYDHYLDGVNYDKRPSVWVETLSDFGEGSVKLVEIPTNDETQDNIVTFWNSSKPAKAGDELRYKYRLHWLGDEPYPAQNVARVAATRIGRGGEPGKTRPAHGLAKFVIEFEGKPLSNWPGKEKIVPDITVSSGQTSYIFVEPVGSTKRWRLQFDLAYTDDKPVELRAYLRTEDKRPLTETWLFQYQPTTNKS